MESGDPAHFACWNSSLSSAWTGLRPCGGRGDLCGFRRTLQCRDVEAWSWVLSLRLLRASPGQLFLGRRTEVGSKVPKSGLRQEGTPQVRVKVRKIKVEAGRHPQKLEIRVPLAGPRQLAHTKTSAQPEHTLHTRHTTTKYAVHLSQQRALPMRWQTAEVSLSLFWRSGDLNCPHVLSCETTANGKENPTAQKNAPYEKCC